MKHIDLPSPCPACKGSVWEFESDTPGPRNIGDFYLCQNCNAVLRIAALPCELVVLTEMDQRKLPQWHRDGLAMLRELIHRKVFGRNTGVKTC